MAKKAEATVEEKLRALYDLQLIDSRVDEIRSVRGELPLEVEDLEDEVLGLKTRLDKLKTDVETVNFEIGAKKNIIDEAKTLIKNTPNNKKMFATAGNSILSVKSWNSRNWRYSWPKRTLRNLRPR
tara:strand:+ start:469 stop:846 length:378 start_codon:yes stop_codon:yes gene_type:complete